MIKNVEKQTEKQSEKQQLKQDEKEMKMIDLETKIYPSISYTNLPWICDSTALFSSVNDLIVCDVSRTNPELISSKAISLFTGELCPDNAYFS